MYGDFAPNLSTSTKLRHICLEYPYGLLEAATSGFHVSRKLGSGTAGTVYRGEMPDGSDVAVKVIDLAALGDDALVAGFEDEIAVLSKFRHPHLVVLIGWARQDTRRFLIYEYLGGGDVQQRLRMCIEQSAISFPWWERLDIALDAATGLAHLHNARPHAFHRDVKTANILLGNSHAKMADFGLSCVAKSRGDRDVTCRYPSGTPGYTCPTYIRTGKVTEGSEVFSFGMVLLELLLNQLPAGMHAGNIVYPINDAVRPGLPGAVQRCVQSLDVTAQWSTRVAAEVAALALSCIDAKDPARPCFNDICRCLRSIRERAPQASSDGALTMAPSVQQLPSKQCGSGMFAAAVNGRKAEHVQPTELRPAKKISMPHPHAGTKEEQLICRVGAGESAQGVVVSSDGNYQRHRRAPHPFAGRSSSATRAVARSLTPPRSRAPACPVDHAPLPRPASDATAAAAGAAECQAQAGSLRHPASAMTPRAGCGVSVPVSHGCRDLTPPRDASVTLRRPPQQSAHGHQTPPHAAPVHRRYSCNSDYAGSVSIGPFLNQERPRGPTAAHWVLECIFGEGCSMDALASLPFTLRTYPFKLTPDMPTVKVGRQHQTSMFEAVLEHRRDLLGFVSRSHLQLQSDGFGGMYATNLSPNIALIGNSVLHNGRSTFLTAGDTLSFAAQVELLRGGDAASFASASSNQCEGRELDQPLSVAPFITLRLMPAAFGSCPADSASHAPHISKGVWFAPRSISSGGA